MLWNQVQYLTTAGQRFQYCFWTGLDLYIFPPSQLGRPTVLALSPTCLSSKHPNLLSTYWEKSCCYFSWLSYTCVSYLVLLRTLRCCYLSVYRSSTDFSKGHSRCSAALSLFCLSQSQLSHHTWHCQTFCLNYRQLQI